MKNMRCPNCDGPFDIPSQRSVIVCMYCGTTIQVHSGEIFKEHYIMRLQYTSEQASEKMLAWAMKQLGAPKDLEENTEIQQAEVTFYPFWVVEVEAIANYTGTQSKPRFGTDGVAPRMRSESVPETGHLEAERDIAIPATSNMPGFLTSYVIPTKRKEFFNKDLILEVGAHLQQADVDRDFAIESAKGEMAVFLQDEAKKEVDRITKMDGDLKTPAIFLVHVPVWNLKYKYGIRSYHALVDGASGRVISMKFPRKVAFRAMTLLGGLLHLIVGDGIGLLLVYLGLTGSNLLFPTLTGIVFGLGMLAISLQFFAKSISIRAEEESAE